MSNYLSYKIGENGKFRVDVCFGPLSRWVRENPDKDVYLFFTRLTGYRHMVPWLLSLHGITDDWLARHHLPSIGEHQHIKEWRIRDETKVDALIYWFAALRDMWERWPLMMGLYEYANGDFNKFAAGYYGVVGSNGMPHPFINRNRHYGHLNINTYKMIKKFPFEAADAIKSSFKPEGYKSIYGNSALLFRSTEFTSSCVTDGTRLKYLKAVFGFVPDFEEIEELVSKYQKQFYAQEREWNEQTGDGPVNNGDDEDEEDDE